MRYLAVAARFVSTSAPEHELPVATNGVAVLHGVVADQDMLLVVSQKRGKIGTWRGHARDTLCLEVHDAAGVASSRYFHWPSTHDNAEGA